MPVKRQWKIPWIWTILLQFFAFHTMVVDATHPQTDFSVGTVSTREREGHSLVYFQGNMNVDQSVPPSSMEATHQPGPRHGNDCGVSSVHGSLRLTQSYNGYFEPSMSRSMTLGLLLIWLMQQCFGTMRTNLGNKRFEAPMAIWIGHRRRAHSRRALIRRNRLQAILASRRRLGWGLQALLLAAHFHSVCAAMAPNPQDEHHPAQVLQNVINDLQLPATDEVGAAQQLATLFDNCQTPIRLPIDEFLQLHSYKPGHARRSTYTTRAELPQGLRRLRDLWAEFPDLNMAAVQPSPPAEEGFTEESHWVLWQPLPREWVVGLWDIWNQEGRLLQRQALCIPRPIAHQELLRFLGLHAFCRSSANRCQWHRGRHEWFPMDIFQYQFSSGYYLKLTFLPAQFGLQDFWRSLAEAPAREAPEPPQFMFRLGEADNPGPSFWFGTANPGGLRGKEGVLTTLPEGLWGVQETHLSGITQPPCLRALRATATSQGKANFVTAGAPVALRARSAEAGTWSGVLCWSAGVPQEVHIPWPDGEYRDGRVQCVKCWFGALPVTCLNLYGWAKSPTWPFAVRSTNHLLQKVTEELVLSGGGLRLICGDFNISEEHTPCVRLWKEAGWQEIQAWAHTTLAQEPSPTCKHSTYPDRVYVSPEMVPFLREVRLWDLFSDHRPLACRVDLPLQSIPQQVWPLPQEVPWEMVDKEAWKASSLTQMSPTSTSNINEKFEKWCLAYEDSFDGHIQTLDKKLPKQCRGRGQRTSPLEQDPMPPLIRPSRQGELRPATPALNREVQRWFLQLRRLQSLCHALRAQKETAAAQLYRAELWRCIRLSRGFGGTFNSWWPSRPHRCHGSPDHLPEILPGLQVVLTLFQDFELNYRAFESWHLRRRRELLQLTFRDKIGKLFRSLKPAHKAGLHHLQKDTPAEVVEVLHPGDRVRLSRVLPQGELVDYALGPHKAMLTFLENDTVQIDTDGLLFPGLILTATEHYATAPAIHEELQRYWKTRWWKETPPSQQDWTRILSFGRAYLPPGQMEWHRINEMQWSESNKRYTDHSARGPDGISRLDLVMMPSSLTSSLLQQIHTWEARSQWPDALLTGFVHGLPKRDHSRTAGDYRPVTIYSMLYRTWGSIRARQALRFLHDKTSGHQFGYLAKAETAEMWYLSQALIEQAASTSSPLMGLVTDIQKAFESIPRLPIQKLALWLGIPQQVVKLWFHFLEHTGRRFLVANQVGDPLYSNSGFPEGCAMSCVSMTVLSICFHQYQKKFAERTICLSYVDNLELLAPSGEDLMQGLICLQSWADMWSLELDLGKTYCWGANSTSRAACNAFPYPVKRAAKDLGAAMTYGAGIRNQEQLARIATLEPLWPLLRRSVASYHQKGQIIRQAFWPKAFHGSSICRIGHTHLQKLRTLAVRALGHGKAGASPEVPFFYLLRLILVFTKHGWYFKLFSGLAISNRDSFACCGPLS